LSTRRLIGLYVSQFLSHIGDILRPFRYVDEVQDNLLIDARRMSALPNFCSDLVIVTLVLRSLCRNPHGLFWAGDTAQQIASTAFRFSDLKAFLHRLEVRHLF